MEPHSSVTPGTSKGQRGGGEGCRGASISKYIHTHIVLRLEDCACSSRCYPCSNENASTPRRLAASACLHAH